MKSNVVILIGATGNLGGRIARELRAENATVRCLVRPETSPAKRQSLMQFASEVVEVNFADTDSISKACMGGDVVVSALAGLRDVVVELQDRVLQGSIKAGVPRFIPSDFSIDYRPIPPGENRNLNLREEFRRILDASPVRATSVLCGGFMDMLTGQAPFILFPINRVLCWGDCDQPMDFTLIDDVARYTAKAALDPTTPRYLKIAGDELSANKLARIMTELTGKPHRVLKPGGLSLFKGLIKLTRLLTPDRGDLYPAWQGMQYMHNMYKGDSKFERLDNGRYGMEWTTAGKLLNEYLHNKDHVRHVIKK